MPFWRQQLDKEAAAAAAAAEENALVVAHVGGVGVSVGGDFTSVPDDDISWLMGKEQASSHRVPLSCLLRSVGRCVGACADWRVVDRRCNDMVKCGLAVVVWL